MRAAPSHGLVVLLALVGGCGESSVAEDAGGMDAPLDDARDAGPATDAPLPDVFALDAPGLDAPTEDAPTDDAFGADALGTDTLGADAFGADAYGPDAFGPDAFGIDALSRDANDDIGSRLDRCTAGCDYITSCGSSGCASFGIDCSTVGEEQACIVDCLRGYSCADLSGVGFSSCTAACRAPVDAAYPDVFAADTRSDSGSLPDRCTAGCDYLLGCGFSTCTTLGVDCTMGTESQACLADCLRGFACVDVPGVGYTYCQEECAGSVDAGPPNDAGPGPAACSACGMSRCGSELTPCLADSTCSQLALCVASCEDTACRDDCLTRYAVAPALRDPLLSCLCTRCAGPCDQIDPCSI